MSKFRTVVSVIIMIIAGAFLNDAMGGAILFSMISGIACIIYTLDNPRK